MKVEKRSWEAISESFWMKRFIAGITVSILVAFGFFSIPWKEIFGEVLPPTLAIIMIIHIFVRYHLEEHGFVFEKWGWKWSHPVVFLKNTEFWQSVRIGLWHLFIILFPAAILSFEFWPEWGMRMFVFALVYEMFHHVSETWMPKRFANAATIRVYRKMYEAVSDHRYGFPWLVSTVIWMLCILGTAYSLQIWHGITVYREDVEIWLAASWMVSLYFVFVMHFFFWRHLYLTVPANVSLKIATMAVSGGRPIEFAASMKAAYLWSSYPLVIFYVVTVVGMTKVGFFWERWWDLQQSGISWLFWIGLVLFFLRASSKWWRNLFSSTNYDDIETDAVEIATQAGVKIMLAQRNQNHSDRLLAQALMILVQGIEKMPYSAILRRMLGDLFCHGFKNYQTAISHYDEAIAFEPLNPENYKKKAAALYEIGDDEGALRESVFATVLNPRDPFSGALVYSSILQMRDASSG